MMKRLPGWRLRLDGVIDDIKRKSFNWHSHDCWLGLVVPCVSAVSGVDMGRGYRSKYKSARAAVKLMKSKGFDNLGDLVASHMTEISVSRAKFGDVVAIPTDDAFGFTLGVVNGERVFVLREDGLGTVDLRDATRAFKVG